MVVNESLPDGWATVKVAEIGIAITGNTPPTQNEANYGTSVPFVKPPQLVDRPILSSKDFLSDQGAKLARVLPPLSVLVSCIGNLGKTAINKVPVAFNQQINAITPFKCISPFYLFYQVQSHPFRSQLESKASATTISIVNKGNFETILLNLPPLAEQHRIVAKIEELFSELDKGIESLKTAQAQLKVYRQALLKHAFEGKLTAQWRADNPDKLETADALLQRIQQERAQRYQQQLAEWEAGGKQGSKPKAQKPLPALTAGEISDLPSLPDGWVWARLGDIFFDSPKNGIYKSADHYGSGFSIIRIDDFYDGSLIKTSGFKKLRLSEDEITAFRANVGDILINRVNSIEYLGKCCEIKGLSEPVVFESNIMKVSINTQMAAIFFVTTYLSSSLGRKKLCENAKHAVNQASINQTDVAMTPIAITQLEEQIVIAEKLSSHLSVIDQLARTATAALQQAEALRQTILKKAFSGQLVPQDPNDEPASILLERIKIAKAAHTKPPAPARARKSRTS